MHLDVGHAIGSAGKLACIWLALPEVAPLRRVEAETTLLCFHRDIDDAGTRDRSKCSDLGDVVHEIGVGLAHEQRHSSRSLEMR